MKASYRSVLGSLDGGASPKGATRAKVQDERRKVGSVICRRPGRGVSRGDVVGLADYARVRPEYRRYMLDLKRRRRMRLGPLANLLFESFETVLYQIHEVLRVEGAGAARIAREVEQYGRLVPRPSAWCATLMVDDPIVWRGQKLAAAAGQPGGLRLVCGARSLGSELVGGPADPEDPVQYLAWHLDQDFAREMRAGVSRLGVEALGVVYEATPALRGALTDDLHGSSPGCHLHRLIGRRRGVGTQKTL